MTPRLLFSKQSSKLDIKDIHQTLWKCRDFELTSLWQRSIFLTTLLVLCYTGYGFLFSAIVNKKEVATVIINAISPHPEQDSKSFLILHAAAFFLSVVGVLFSCLWIAMAKGSKAWYERYEKTIYAFEMNPNNIEYRAKPYAAFQGYNMVKDEDKAGVNDSIFSMKGGAYSPSKINIAIGQISAFIFLTTCVVHIYIIFQTASIFNVKSLSNIKDILPNLILLLTPFLIIFLLLRWHCGWLKSSIIEDTTIPRSDEAPASSESI